MELPPDEFQTLLARVRSGSQEAGQELFARYAPAVRRVIERLVDNAHHTLPESDDFEQSVWKSFFDTPEEYTFNTPSDLIAFLSRLARNKVISATRKAGAQKRGNFQTRSLQEPKSPDGSSLLGDDILGPDQTPSQVLSAKEDWERLTQYLPSGHIRILELLRAGYTTQEIASHVGLDRRIVHRILDKLRRTVSQYGQPHQQQPME